MIPIAIHEKAVQNTFYKLQREGMKNVAITSARRREGVSAFSYALARRAAAAGIKVLLVDFNFTHLGQSDILALEHYDWVPSMHMEQCSIQHISNTNLSVLSSPHKVNDIWPFQDQNKICQMLDNLGNNYDLVIADMPSILEPESELQVEILCAAFDAAIMMVSSGKTLETDMTKVKNILDEADVNILGAIMNDQFMPPLSEELKRQLDKVYPYFSRMTNYLKWRIDKSAFLNQSL